MKIEFNGQEYGSVEEMPPEARQEYDALVKRFGLGSDGLPNHPGGVTEERIIVEETITYNGKEYRSRDELPPEVRELFDRLPAAAANPESRRLDVKTRLLPPKVEIIRTEFRGANPPEQRSFPWMLVLLLCAAVGVLLWLWLSGKRPGDVFGH